MAARRATPPTVPAAESVPGSGGVTAKVLRPLQEFVGPGRRKTDNPLVVGVIVLCLGIIATSSIVQITATLWAGSQLRTLLDTQAARDNEVNKVRERLFKNTEAQAIVLRRLCLNVARDEKEKTECLAVGPTLNVPPPKDPH